MQNDPGQLNNLVNSPEFKKRRIKFSVKEWRKNTKIW
jgi:hypothetical protein